MKYRIKMGNVWYAATDMYGDPVTTVSSELASEWDTREAAEAVLYGLNIKYAKVEEVKP